MDPRINSARDWIPKADEEGLLPKSSQRSRQNFPLLSTRSGGPVAIEADQTVIVRAHMDPEGYGQQALQGSVAEGFTAVELLPSFAEALAQQDPLPSGCAF